MGRTLKPPLDLVLAWQTDAYPHGVRRDHTLLILATVFSAIAFIFVLVRLIARLGVQRNPGLDDLFIVPALISTIGMNVCIAYTSRHGFDRHVWDLTPQMAVNLRKFTFSISFLYIWGTGLTKISVLFFYRRLTGSLPMPFLYAVYASLFYVSAYLVTFTISLGLTCNPVYAYWKQVDFIWAAANATKFKCIDEGATLIATNAISITQDFLACTMPALLLWNLQVNKRQKIAMGALLGVSIFPCVAGILRFIYLYRAAYTTYDIPWEMFPSWIWTLIEANVGLLCASVPALRVFFKRTLQISFQRSRSEEKDSGPMVPTIGRASRSAIRKFMAGGEAAGTGSVAKVVTTSTAESCEHGGIVDMELKDLERTMESRDGEGCSGSTRTESMESAGGTSGERRLVWWGRERER